MKIKSLSLRNFCQHENLELEFSTGLNGILGKNGSGKSNILAAIQYALTGYTKDTVDSYIRQSAGPDETSYVKLTVISDVSGDTVEITRKLRPRTVSMRDTDGEILRKTAEINARLYEVFGLDPSVVQNIQIVPQEELVAFFRLQPALRSALLLRIYGADVFQHRRDALRLLLSSLREESDMQQQVKLLQDMIAENEHKLSCYKDIPDTDILLEQKTSITQKRDAVAHIISKTLAYQFALEELHRHEEGIALTKRNIQKNSSTFSEDTLKLKRDALSLIIKEKEASDNVRRQYHSFNTALQEGIPLLSSVESVLSVLQSCDLTTVLSLQRLSDELNLNRAMLAQVEPSSASGVCPVCGRAYPEAPDRYASLKEEYNGLIPRYSYAKANYDAYCTARNDFFKIYGVWVAHIDRVLSSFSAVVPKELVRLQGALNDRIVSTVSRDLSEITDFSKTGCLVLLSNLKRAFQRLCDSAPDLCADSDAAYALLCQQEESCRAALLALEDQSRQLTRDSDYIKEHELSIQAIYASPAMQDVPQNTNIDSLRKEQAEYDAQLKTISDNLTACAIRAHVLTMISELTDKVHILETRIKKRAGLVEYRADLDQILELLHPDRLPRAAILGMSQVVMENMNSYLCLFNAPFSVMMDQNTELHCIFPDEVIQPAGRLSGGQKVVLALAWRLALHSTFSTEESCGFLTLDEPTTFLDEDNIDNLTSVIQQIRDLAAERNIQILIITHEQSLSPLFDTVIQL